MLMKFADDTKLEGVTNNSVDRSLIQMDFKKLGKANGGKKGGHIELIKNIHWKIFNLRNNNKKVWMEKWLWNLIRISSVINWFIHSWEVLGLLLGRRHSFLDSSSPSIGRPEELYCLLQTFGGKQNKATRAGKIIF